MTRYVCSKCGGPMRVVGIISGGKTVDEFYMCFNNLDCYLDGSDPVEVDNRGSRKNDARRASVWETE